MFLELWLLRQVEANRSTAEDGVRKSGEAKRQVDGLSDRVDRLVLLSTALWSLLHEKLGVTEEQLEARVREIDLRDGHLDGRIRPTAALQCPSCARTVSRRHVRCIYCGMVLPSSGSFGAAT